MILKLAAEHDVLLTIEEGATGGFGSQVLHVLANEGALDGNLKIRSLTMADEYTDHGKPDVMYASSSLDADGIVKSVFEALGRDVNEAAEAGEIA
jgi:1-deoxy-D-xylulose-5-phosphate synthase